MSSLPTWLKSGLIAGVGSMVLAAVTIGLMYSLQSMMPLATTYILLMPVWMVMFPLNFSPNPVSTSTIWLTLISSILVTGFGYFLLGSVWGYAYERRSPTGRRVLAILTIILIACAAGAVPLSAIMSERMA